MKRKVVLTVGLIWITILISLVPANADFNDYQYNANPYHTWSSCNSTIITWRVYSYEGEKYAWGEIEKCGGGSFSKNGVAEIVEKSTGQVIAQKSYAAGISRVSLTFDPYGDYDIVGRNAYEVRLYPQNDPDTKITAPIDIWTEFATAVEATLNGSRWTSVEVCYGSPGGSSCGDGYYNKKYLPDTGSGPWNFYMEKQNGYTVSLTDNSPYYDATLSDYNSLWYLVSVPVAGMDVVASFTSGPTPTPTATPTSIPPTVTPTPIPSSALTRANLYVDNRNYLVLEFCGINIHQNVYIGSKREGRDFGIHSKYVDFGLTETCAIDDNLADGTVLSGTTYEAGVALAQQDVYTVCNSNQGQCDSVTTSAPSSGFYLPYPGGTTRICTRAKHKPGTATYHAIDWSKGDGKVVAARDGRVVYVKQDSDKCKCDPKYAEYANMVIIRHSDNTETLYVHLKKDSVPVEELERNDWWVKSGQEIGQIGCSGYVCGEHLHYYVRQAGGGNPAISTSFVDITTNNGQPQTGHPYTSGNYLSLLKPFSPMGPTDVRDYPPQGSVKFELTGSSTHLAQLDAYDYESDVIQMRVASTYEGLLTTAWQPLASQVPWTSSEVWAQYQDEYGNLSEVYSDTVDAIAYQPVQADFSIESSTCTGDPVSITNLTAFSCPQCGWFWDMGNGITSTFANPRPPYFGYPDIMYPESGIYTITLTADSAVNSSSESKSITVLPKPEPDFELTLVDNTITVEAKTKDAQSWEWNFGDGATATGQTATHTYGTEINVDTPPVQLQVTGINGCIAESHRYPTEARMVPLFLPIVIK